MPDKPEWCIVHLGLWPAVTLIDGTKSTGALVMVRVVDGKKQYREPMPAEIDDYVSREAW